MSPASKSRSKDNKSAPKAGKEQSNSSTKPSAMRLNINHGSPARAHHSPVIETSHAIGTLSAFSPPRNSGQFRTVDDPDDHSTSSQGTTAEYDSSSNNSCSGESEDQKEKPTISPLQAETILSSDNDKRDKNRQKNEKKHQRQKEKRAQELHERCAAFLTSRKLEALSHQLVAMGFPTDLATMAVIINKGRMEECVAWLLHEREDNKQHVSVNLEDKSCIAIDIADELTKITKMMVTYKCSRQDVERAVVACEGDLLNAEENLKVQKLSVADESLDSMKLNDKEVTPNNSPALIKDTVKGAATIAVTQLRHDGRYSNNLSKSAPKLTDWLRNQAAPVNRRWSTISTQPSSVLPVQPSVPPAKRETQAPKEPFVVMQRPKNTHAVVDTGNKHIMLGTNDSTMQQSYHQNSLQPVQLSPAEPLASARASSHLWSASRANSSPLTTMSSPGLFTGWGLPYATSESSSQNGWSTRGSTPNRDYTAIDWSLDLTPLRPSMKIDAVSNTWSTMFMGRNAVRPPPPRTITTSSLVNNDGIYFPGSQEIGPLTDSSGPGSSLEWSSPFEGRDLFRVPRQYVTSTSLY